MLKIVKSLVVIALVGAFAASATGAYFSDTATITQNTFSTGTLEIRVNGQPSVVGATFAPMAPDQIGNSPQYEINNYGLPWFAGPSNLTAKSLSLAVVNPNDSGSGLWDKVMVTVEVNRGWPTWQQAYTGKLKDMGTVGLLAPRWTDLIPGSSESLRYHVWLPNELGDQSSLMGKTLTWDFVVEGRTN